MEVKLNTALTGCIEGGVHHGIFAGFGQITPFLN
jgi:hypothetical protein